MSSAALPPMTADELLVQSPRHKSTEVVRGRMLVREPPSLFHGVASARLLYLLAHHVYARTLGVVCAQDTGFHLFTDPDTVRAPDVAFIRAERAAVIPPTGYGRTAPDLAVEILSPGDRRGDVLAKVEDWLKAGVSLLWVIEPKRVTAKVYRGDGSIALVSSTGDLDGEDVVPGFRCALADVFT
ncbi:MAG: Uma2 family endonuclease [Gemmatimonadaceae bacterium]|nr:Uma2 family endonuclease [Gemmatimonadaceae bacterium]